MGVFLVIPVVSQSAVVKMVLLKIALTEKELERFWCKVDKKSDDECWNWIAGKSAYGYGQFSIKNKIYGAHRISYIIHNGEIPEDDPYHGYCICHKCDNPSCVNPAHLFIGTTKENIQDMVNKGRLRWVIPETKGEKNGQHKLSEEQVREIREKYIPYKYSVYKLAKEYNVSKSTIGYVVTYKRWQHLLVAPAVADSPASP